MVNKLLFLLNDEDAERRTVETYFGTVAAGDDDEQPVFIAPHPCEVVAAGVVNAADIALDATDYLTLILMDKGADGSGTNEIGKIETKTGGQAFTAFDEVEFSTIDATHRILAEGDVVSLKKVASGSGKATDDMIAKLEYKRH